MIKIQLPNKNQFSKSNNQVWNLGIGVWPLALRANRFGEKLSVRHTALAEPVPLGNGSVLRPRRSLQRSSDEQVGRRSCFLVMVDWII